MSNTKVPKAVLYYSPTSVWSASVLLTLAEKGYGDDELELKEVDIAKGENFAPSFLRLNPNATVPTLVVPFKDSLSSDMENRYKALTDTTSILAFLDKSRSSQSKTHSTSGLPAPTLAPATIEFSSKSSSLISKLHEENLDPNNLFFCNAHDDASLKKLSQFMLPFLKGRDEALTKFLQESQSGEYTYVSGKVKSFWESKHKANLVLLEVFTDSDKDSAQLDPEAKKKREEYFEAAGHAWKVNLKEGLIYISQHVVGPYVLGDQPSLADLHLAAWLARIAALVGAQHQDNGARVVGKIQQWIGDDFQLPEDFETTRPSGFGSDQVTPTATEPGGVSAPLKVRQARLAVFWDAFSKRPSWEKVYGKAGLY